MCVLCAWKEFEREAMRKRSLSLLFIYLNWFLFCKLVRSKYCVAVDGIRQRNHFKSVWGFWITLVIIINASFIYEFLNRVLYIWQNIKFNDADSLVALFCQITIFSRHIKAMHISNCIFSNTQCFNTIRVFSSVDYYCYYCMIIILFVVQRKETEHKNQWRKERNERKDKKERLTHLNA